MANEFLDIIEVKNEFLRNVGPDYARSYPPQQLEFALFLLNDFCNNLAGNGLLLFKQDEPRPMPMPEQYAQRPVPMQEYGSQYPPRRVQSVNPFEEDERFRQQQQQEWQQPRPQVMDREAYEIQRNINEMNAQLQQPPRMQPPQQRVIPRQEYVPRQEAQYMPPRQEPQPEQDINLANEKPKTFVDKIKEMRTPRKTDQINPEE